MANDSKIHHRRSIRLQGYDYSRAGFYFITVCTQLRQCLFGQIGDGEMRLNDAGNRIQTIWNEMPMYYPGIETDAFVIMSNHIHGIIVAATVVGAGPRACPDEVQSCDGGQPGTGQPQGVVPTLPDVVHRFKTMTTKRYVDGVKNNGWTPFPGRLW